MVEARFGFSSPVAASVVVALGAAGVTCGGAAQLIERKQHKNKGRKDDMGTPLNESDTASTSQVPGILQRNFAALKIIRGLALSHAFGGTWNRREYRFLCRVDTGVIQPFWV